MYNYFKIAIVALLSIYYNFSYAQGVSMSPTRLFFTGLPGEEVSQNVVLNNASDTDYFFNVNIKDWDRDEEGSKFYYPAGVLETSNSSWVSTLETNINLPAKSTKEVTISMRIPPGSSTSDLTNSMLFFTQIGQQTNEQGLSKGIGVITLFEFGLHIYYTPSGNNITSLDIVGIADEVSLDELSRVVKIRLFNDGNVVNDAMVALELTNSKTGEELKLDPVNISMMPSTNQTVAIKLPVDLKGSYIGVVIVKMAGSNDLRIGEKSFQF